MKMPGWIKVGPMERTPEGLNVKLRARWRHPGVWLALIVALLTGCASGLTVPKEVRVAVPVACIDPKDRPAPPVLLTDGEILALDSYRATWALWGDRLDRQAYETRLEAVVEGCVRLPVVTP